MGPELGRGGGGAPWGRSGRAFSRRSVASRTITRSSPLGGHWGGVRGPGAEQPCAAPQRPLAAGRRALCPGPRAAGAVCDVSTPREVKGQEGLCKTAAGSARPCFRSSHVGLSASSSEERGAAGGDCVLGLRRGPSGESPDFTLSLPWSALKPRVPSSLPRALRGRRLPTRRARPATGRVRGWGRCPQGGPEPAALRSRCLTDQASPARDRPCGRSLARSQRGLQLL